MELHRFSSRALLPLLISSTFLASPAFADTASLLKLNVQGSEPQAASQFVNAMQQEPDTQAVRLATVDQSLLQPRMEAVTLTTTDGDSISYQVYTSLLNDDGSQTWIGNTQGASGVVDSRTGQQKPDPLNVATLVFSKDGELNGTFRKDGQLYQLFSIQGVPEQVAIVKVDESKIDEGDDEYDDDATSASRAVTCTPEDGSYVDPTDNQVTIRVALITTNQSRKKLTNLDALSKVAFAEANQGAADSNVQIHFESAGILNADYDENTTFSKILDEMRTKSGTQLSKDIDAFREKNGADLAVMLSATTTESGKGTNDASKSNAFAVIRSSKLTGTYTFAHEMGHNIGASHELAQYTNNLPKRTPCYRHGIKVEPSVGIVGWRTIMSYDCEKSKCSRINYFSNPRLTYRGRPMGSIQYEDNARRLNERREVVAAFYPPVSAPENPTTPPENPTTPPENPGNPGAECPGYTAWDSSKTYSTYGEKVSYKGKVYQQNFQSVNMPPDQHSAPWGEPWIYVKDCD